MNVWVKGLPEVLAVTALGLMGASLEYLTTSLGFLLDSLSQLTSDMSMSMSVSLNKCFLACCFFCKTKGRQRLNRTRKKEVKEMLS